MIDTSREQGWGCSPLAGSRRLTLRSCASSAPFITVMLAAARGKSVSTQAQRPLREGTVPRPQSALLRSREPARASCYLLSCMGYAPQTCWHAGSMYYKAACRRSMSTPFSLPSQATMENTTTVASLQASSVWLLLHVALGCASAFVLAICDFAGMVLLVIPRGACSRTLRCAVTNHQALTTLTTRRTRSCTWTTGTVSGAQLSPCCSARFRTRPCLHTASVC